MTTIDPKTKLMDYKGKPLQRRDVEGGPSEDLDFATAVQVAISHPLPGDEKLDFKQKYQLHKLAERCENPIAQFNAKDTTTILERVSKVFGATVVGRVKELIDPEPEDEKPATKTNGAGAADAALHD